VQAKPAHGFSVIELLLGIALTVCLAMAVSPLLLSLERTAVAQGDQGICLLQGRVAVARLERDLRLASAEGCEFPTETPILSAKESELVFLLPASSGSGLLIVEWQHVSGALMRRQGPCPEGRPLSISQSLFSDHKTMVEGVLDGAGFTYDIGARVVPTAAAWELPLIRSVRLTFEAKAEKAAGTVRLLSRATVGR